MEDLTGQRGSPSRAVSNETALDQHSMPWLTSSADKRITKDPHSSDSTESIDEDDESEASIPRITRVRHHKILKRVRQKLQRY